MNGLKAVGVVVLVFVLWCIGAFFLMTQQHIGQTYDPTFGGVGAWFVDNSPAAQRQAAIWTGQAITAGVVVSIVAGLIYYFRKGLSRFSK